MSSTVRQYGFVAVLLKPVTSQEERDEVNENLWADKSDLRLNYEGTLLYIDYNANKPMREREDIYGLFLGSPEGDDLDFIHQSNNKGLNVDADTVKPYNCIYYNGGDSPLDMLTKEQFMEHDEE